MGTENIVLIKSQNPRFLPGFNCSSSQIINLIAPPFLPVFYYSVTMDHVNVYQTGSGVSKCISQRESLMSFDRTPKNVSFGRSEEKKKKKKLT